MDRVSRYVLFDEIGSGGMASVFLARQTGDGGFGRTVAVKRLHPQYAKDDGFVEMFLDEARIASRIHHPNVVTTLDVVRTPPNLEASSPRPDVLIVMDFVLGESLAKVERTLRKSGAKIPFPIALAIFRDLLAGLGAAHSAVAENGEPLGVVHRDVSPQNVLIGVDGVARILDFGVAKASRRYHESTGDGRVKGKLAYMAPEQVRAETVDARADVFAASIVAWEMLEGRRLFEEGEPASMILAVLERPIPRLSGVPRGIAEVVARGLSRDTSVRFGSADAMARALEKATAGESLASAREVAAWLRTVAGEAIDARSKLVRRVETASLPDTAPSLAPPPSVREAMEPSLAETQHVAAEPQPRRAVRAVGWLLAAVVLVGGGWAGFRLAAARVQPPQAIAEPSAAPLPVIVDAGAAEAVVEPQAMDAGAPVSPGSTGTPRTPGVTRPPPKGSVRAPRPKKSCTPPYEVLPSGDRRYRPECM